MHSSLGWDLGRVEIWKSEAHKKRRNSYIPPLLRFPIQQTLPHESRGWSPREGGNVPTARDAAVAIAREKKNVFTPPPTDSPCRKEVGFLWGG